MFILFHLFEQSEYLISNEYRKDYISLFLYCKIFIIGELGAMLGYSYLGPAIESHCPDLRFIKAIGSDSKMVMGRLDLLEEPTSS